jgi:hypothetical protein
MLVDARIVRNMTPGAAQSGVAQRNSRFVSPSANKIKLPGINSRAAEKIQSQPIIGTSIFLKIFGAQYLAPPKNPFSIFLGELMISTAPKLSTKVCAHGAPRLR